MTHTAKDNRTLFLQGFRDGTPIALGYFAVSFSLGIMMKRAGLSPFEGFLASFLTNASAGEYAGIVVMAEQSGQIQMALMTLVASARYFLMSCALSQRLSPEMPFYHRFLMAFDLTDEIFGVQIGQEGYVKPVRTYGLFILPLLGWSLGTLFGIVTGSLLPENIVNALAVSLYGMFIAIIVPPSKKDPVVLGTVLVSFVLSFAFSRLPVLSKISEGTRTILLTVLIAGAAAAFFPVKEEEVSHE